MEIERQFLIEKFPDLPEIYSAQVWQSYLSVAPVVRIRRRHQNIHRTYQSIAPATVSA